MFKHDLYIDFITENPDNQRKLSRTKFYRWLKTYGIFKYDVAPLEGRDGSGRWIEFRTLQDIQQNGTLDI